RGLAPRRNVAEEAQSICLVATFLVLPGERQCTLSQGLCLSQAAGLQMRLPQGKTTDRLIADYACGRGLFERPYEQRHGVSDAPAQRVRSAQDRCHSGEIEWEA